ncbi:MAG: hypothetical protein UU73_C0003G0147 [Candidatus Daviesbacteria bacterium GW2011_GWA1_41_61]|nr:MAG: hypothetical protein UU26_C0003G0079 [Candidatus Daviesbacteria bacterium GW2011_GWC1_40_9]KKR93503.1 MAG: hypothetical protein UU44_C0002G0164 [Candidatus Daviesbacteria bacterium GW2011_GWB1_41_15]KKS14948.1 MAG: hypothetical protein UU73_C0003G0147 [Candidatus Daviesbacteria bacterium GW2011_GWA1_41_61]
MAIVNKETLEVAHEVPPLIPFPRGSRFEYLELPDGRTHRLHIVSFRDPRHTDVVVSALARDEAIAFHGWGVSGMGCRADNASDSRKFWLYKEGRPLGAKVPLLEPPKYAVEHIDWQSVHKQFRHLQDPRLLKELWENPILPYHLIFPYRSEGRTLNEAVVTPAHDKEVASDVPVPTICLFWTGDPAIDHLVRKVKKACPEAQIAVSSLNDSGETPSFTTPELIAYFQQKGKTHWTIIVEDPLLEPLDIASSHSQFIVPLADEEPVFGIKRIGSLSPGGFSEHIGLKVKIPEKVKIASRRVPDDVILDEKLYQADALIHSWQKGLLWQVAGSYFEDLKERLHLV